MKSSALFSLAFLALSACGTQSGVSSTNAVKAAKVLVFSRDARPVDGALKEITMRERADGRFDVSLRTAFYDRLGGREVDETKTLVEGARCKIARNVVCSRDDRPVDGLLKEIVLTKNGNAFDATGPSGLMMVNQCFQTGRLTSLVVNHA